MEGCIGGLLPDDINGPKPPTIALKVHLTFSITVKTGGKSVFIDDEDDDNEDGDDDGEGGGGGRDGGSGFPIDMNCDQKYDSETFPNDDLNHVYKAFCPKMCFS